MSLEQLRLENQFCFLIYRLEHKILGKYRPHLESLGLTYPQYLVMLALWEHGEMGVAKVAGLLELDTGTISPLLKRMEVLGLLTRRRDPGDERSVRVSLTPKGQELEALAADVPGKMTQCLVPQNSGVDAAELMRALREVLNTLEGTCLD